MTRSHPNPARAVPTTHSGVEFRSRLEARWAVTFDLLGWAYEYEPLAKTATPYLPDFWLATLEVYCEIKPWRIGDHYMHDEWPPLRDKIENAHLDAPLILLGSIYGYRRAETHADYLAYGFGGLGWRPGFFPGTQVRRAWTESGNKTRWRPTRTKTS